MNKGFSKIKEVVSDPQTLMFEMRRNKKDLVFWIAGIMLVLLTFTFLSSRDYSFLLVLSSTTQMLSFLIVIIKVYSHQNISGLSQNTFISYLIVLASRLSSTMLYPGYLPSDKAGDWFYQTTEVISLVSSICLVYMIRNTYRDTANIHEDSIDFSYLAVPTLGLALLVHTSLNRNFVTDVLWTFSMYLESVAILPQIFLFFKKKGQIESYTSHYVALQGLSRLFSLIFWYDTYDELNSSFDDSYSMFHSYCGYFIVISQVIQLIIMLDYYYHYIKALLKNETINMNSI